MAAFGKPFRLTPYLTCLEFVLIFDLIFLGLTYFDLDL